MPYLRAGKRLLFLSEKVFAKSAVQTAVLTFKAGWVQKMVQTCVKSVSRSVRFLFVNPLQSRRRAPKSIETYLRWDSRSNKDPVPSEEESNQQVEKRCPKS